MQLSFPWIRHSRFMSLLLVLLLFAVISSGRTSDRDQALENGHHFRTQSVPSVGLSSYFGGGSSDEISALAVDDAGNVYIAGTTYSHNFPVKNAFQQKHKGREGDGFVAKISSGGSLVFSTYLGGSSLEQLFGIAVDKEENVYVTGGTLSRDFPVTAQAYQTQFKGFGNAFVSKFDATGTRLIYSTYLGGGSEGGRGIAVDSFGNAVVTGTTTSAAFPTKNPIRLYSGDVDGFVTKLNATGSGLIYSTYLGGSDRDEANAVALDPAGNAYITGATRSAFTFPQKRKLFPSHPGFFDSFVTKLTPAGAPVYSVFFGGSQPDFAQAIAVSKAGNVYIGGYTKSRDLPMKNALQPDYAGGQTKAFLAKINAQGTGLIFSTYFGGFGLNGIHSIALDTAASAYISGGSSSVDMVQVIPIQNGNRGQTDAFVAKISPSGRSLLFSSYFGGVNSDVPLAGAVYSAGRLFIAGYTESRSTFPLVNPLQGHYGGGGDDGFITRIDNIP